MSEKFYDSIKKIDDVHKYGKSGLFEYPNDGIAYSTHPYEIVLKGYIYDSIKTTLVENHQDTFNNIKAQIENNIVKLNDDLAYEQQRLDELSSKPSKEEYADKNNVISEKFNIDKNVGLLNKNSIDLELDILLNQMQQDGHIYQPMADYIRTMVDNRGYAAILNEQSINNVSYFKGGVEIDGTYFTIHDIISLAYTRYMVKDILKNHQNELNALENPEFNEFLNSCLTNYYRKSFDLAQEKFYGLCRDERELQIVNNQIKGLSSRINGYQNLIKSDFWIWDYMVKSSMQGLIEKQGLEVDERYMLSNFSPLGTNFGTPSWNTSIQAGTGKSVPHYQENTYQKMIQLRNELGKVQIMDEIDESVIINDFLSHDIGFRVEQSGTYSK